MAERIVPDLRFARRARADGATDSICRHCFATIATAIWEETLDCAEREHVCDPAQLERFQIRADRSPADRSRDNGERNPAHQASRA